MVGFLTGFDSLCHLGFLWAFDSLRISGFLQHGGFVWVDDEGVLVACLVVLGVKALAHFCLIYLASFFEKSFDVFVGVFRPLRFLPNERIRKDESCVVSVHLA